MNERCEGERCVPVMHTEDVDWTPAFVGERGVRRVRCERERGHEGLCGVDWGGEWVEWDGRCGARKDAPRVALSGVHRHLCSVGRVPLVCHLPEGHGDTHNAIVDGRVMAWS